MVEGDHCDDEERGAQGVDREERGDGVRRGVEEGEPAEDEAGEEPDGAHVGELAVAMCAHGEVLRAVEEGRGSEKGKGESRPEPGSAAGTTDVRHDEPGVARRIE